MRSTTSNCIWYFFIIIWKRFRYECKIAIALYCPLNVNVTSAEISPVLCFVARPHDFGTLTRIYTSRKKKTQSFEIPQPWYRHDDIWLTIKPRHIERLRSISFGFSVCHSSKSLPRVLSPTVLEMNRGICRFAPVDGVKAVDIRHPRVYRILRSGMGEWAGVRNWTRKLELKKSSFRASKCLRCARNYCTFTVKRKK